MFVVFFQTTFKTFSCFAFQNVGKGPTTISLVSLSPPFGALSGRISAGLVRPFVHGTTTHTTAYLINLFFSAPLNFFNFFFFFFLKIPNAKTRTNSME
jgi:hypothetical protein